MKTVKHTPGPWVYSLHHENEHGVNVYQIDQHEDAPARDNELYAVCMADVYGDEANAKLIASAPELLEALQELYLAVYGGNSVALKDCINRSVKDDAFEQKIVAAIKKATE